jgi:putative membrane protein
MEGGMALIANIIVAFVALLHTYFLVLEMFFWDKPLGLKTFRMTPEKAQVTNVLAANQGLYNGFLAAGLVWGLGLGDAGTSIKLFFLGCVIVAGLYGAITVGRKILFIQAMPAMVALTLILLS